MDKTICTMITDAGKHYYYCGLAMTWQNKFRGKFGWIAISYRTNDPPPEIMRSIDDALNWITEHA